VALKCQVELVVAPRAACVFFTPDRHENVSLVKVLIYLGLNGLPGTEIMLVTEDNLISSPQDHLYEIRFLGA
jgi:hypothetical protein